MGIGGTLFVFGVLLTITAAVLSPGSPDDFIRWMAKQPLHRILAFRYAAISGMLMAAAGALLSIMR